MMWAKKKHHTLHFSLYLQASELPDLVCLLEIFIATALF